jgi:hypothetical protein
LIGPTTSPDSIEKIRLGSIALAQVLDWDPWRVL